LIGRDFATFTLKKSKCLVQNRLGAPYVAYEFLWGQILNKYAVISHDNQSNDRQVSDCLYFRFAYDLKTSYLSRMTIEYS